MKASHLTALALAGAVALGLSGCKSGDTAADTTAAAIESASDSAADTMDTVADSMTDGSSEAVLHDKADAVRDSGKHKADEVKDAADTSK
jgi:hypothetical protein